MSKSRLALLLGNFAWKRPPWIVQSLAVIRSHRLISSVVALLLLALLTAGAWTWSWYQKRPKPYRVTITVDPIPVTVLEKELHPAALRLRFSSSAARLDQMGKSLTSGVRMEPVMDGKWIWETDTRLVFRPANDWPAEQKYRITFARDFFPVQVRMERYAAEVQTPFFAGRVTQSEFYQDPRDPATKQVVATLEFTHRIDRADLEKHIALRLLGGSAVFKQGNSVPPFTVSYGLHDRLAYVRSAPLQLPEREDFMKMTIAAGVATTQGNARTHEEYETKVRVPDVYSFFKIEGSETRIVRNEDGQPGQVLIINTTAAARSEDIQKALHFYLLPKIESDATGTEESTTDEAEETGEEDQQAQPTGPNEWGGPNSVDAETLQHAPVVPLTLIPALHEQSNTHSFKFAVEAEGRLFLRIDKGIEAPGGFPLRETYENVLRVPPLPREIEIQGRGGILALNGERKLSVKSRGVGVIQYDIARIAPAQINHLVSQSSGRFESPDFNWGFNEENIARIAVEQQPIALENQFKANYSAFDFSQHLRIPSDGGGERGLFLLRAREWDAAKKKIVPGARDRRFVLVTDLGLLVKKSGEGASDVFIVSIQTGNPLAGVAVDVLGKNSLSVAQGVSGADGRVSLPSLGKLEHEKTPVAYVARLGNDVAFMPFARADRALDFSRFDIGGVENISATQLDAFVFTERGIYRPGDEVHIASIVKQRDWAGRLEGLPLELEVIDARGVSAQVQKFVLPAGGFSEFHFATAYESPTGSYEALLYLRREGKRATLLGQTNFVVKEFLPDRMKIETRFSVPAAVGWVNPKAVQAFVSLRSLYGTPASERRIVSRMFLAPRGFRFAAFKDYTFHDPLRENRKAPEPQMIELGEKTTDAEGKATVDLDLERFADATYEMSLTTEGFEAEGGRNVSTYDTLLVSALPRVIGFKADGALDYIPIGTPRTVEFIALDPALQKIAAAKLRFNVVEETYVSILAKKENGNYAFESVLKEKPVGSEVIDLGAEGFHYSLGTETPGNFVLEVRDEEDRRVSLLRFTVVGRGNVARSLEKNAELAVKLDRAEYNAGDEIELSITAPFTGAGLITIESDKVYAHAWFKSSTTSSVQRIRVPAGFDGTGYINVSFVRALDSKEIFMSPLSYAVVPFTVNKEKRRLRIDLRAAEKARPGEPLRIAYRTDRPAKIVVFAVEQGILQVTDFITPDPLGWFFRKSALAVQTAQIVDLIIPEFSILRNTAAFGGDADKRLNPFKRVTEKPVVFWSGVIEADATERELTYDVPDYFDGTLKIMAVACNADAAGSAEGSTLIRGTFVLTPTVPTVAAPGDRFEVGVTIANGVVGSGENAEVTLTAETSAHLEIIAAPAQPLHISEGRETTAIFTVRAKDELGSATVTFHAAALGQEATRRATLSVRPPVPFMAQLRSGNFTGASVDAPVEREMYAEFRQLEATVSAIPLGLAHGLDFYLKTFPHGCTEQISSAAFARLALADETDFSLTRPEVEAQLEKASTTLRRRQNDQGSFGYWSAEAGDGNEFVSVYATHFLSEAKAAGFAPPADLLKSALHNLQTLVAREPRDAANARIIAYAIYVLTREGFITTNYILNLTDYLDRHYEDGWPNDTTRVYLAGAWSLLKKEDAARKLIGGYHMGEHERAECSDFYQPLGADAQYIAILARHFPDLLRHITASEFEKIVGPISRGEFNTLSAAYAVWALKSYSQQVATHPPELSLAEISAGQRETTLTTFGRLVRRTSFSPNAAALRFSARNQPAGLGSFYEVLQAGFDRALPKEPIRRGLEVYREFPATVQLGVPMTVSLRVRSLDRHTLTNVAIVDLLPGGFEIVSSSLRPGVNQAGCDYVEVREDRAVFYATVGPDTRTIRYQIKATNRGEFVVPPAYAESMYDRGVQARGLAGKITVVEAK